LQGCRDGWFFHGWILKEKRKFGSV
jgi:hypothetical protein